MLDFLFVKSLDFVQFKCKMTFFTEKKKIQPCDKILGSVQLRWCVDVNITFVSVRQSQ